MIKSSSKLNLSTMQVAYLSSNTNKPLLLLPHLLQDSDQQDEENTNTTPSPFGSDFGGLIQTRPAAVLHPLSSSDVSAALRLSRLYSLPLAPRGNGHSINGQSQSHRGLLLNMRSLNSLHLTTTTTSGAAADVGAGALWSEVLAWSVATFGLAPASWTDYLDLTVGGTLSNAGISGQAFRRGPQVSSVAELDVVTADGECHVCSRDVEPDLFFAALGGLGQFGVITRARIPLLPAPDMVKWIRIVYGHFKDYKADAEYLVTRPEREAFDYVEGFAFVNSDDPINGYGSVPLSPDFAFDPSRFPPDSGPVLYCLELALHYQQGDNADKRAAEMLRPLKFIRGLEFTTDVSYVDFLTRVKRAEKEARANGSWHAPHPWLNLLVSSEDIVDFDRNVFKKILKDGIGGPMLVYPLVRSKWDPRTSVALPDSEIFYLVALLRFNRPFPDGPPVEDLINQNRRIVECCRSNGYDFKLYLPHYKTESEWEQHFGKGWARFVDRKMRYDPTAILAPGQRIFSMREN